MRQAGEELHTVPWSFCCAAVRAGVMIYTYESVLWAASSRRGDLAVENFCRNAANGSDVGSGRLCKRTRKLTPHNASASQHDLYGQQNQATLKSPYSRRPTTVVIDDHREHQWRLRASLRLLGGSNWQPAIEMHVPRFVAGKPQEPLFETSMTRRPRDYSRLLLYCAFSIFCVALLRASFRWVTNSGPLPQYAGWSIKLEVRRDLAKNLTKGEDKCLWLARNKTQPYTEKYWNQTVDLKGPAYSYFLWENKTEDVNIEQWQVEIQKNTTFIDCRLVLKILHKELYIWRNNYCYERAITNQDPTVYDRWRQTKQLMLLALEVFDIPDMDFVFTLGDSETEGQTLPYHLPSLAYCVGAGKNEKAGFAIPGYSTYSISLGDYQMDYFHECLRQKYPIADRINKVVWRGSTTGPLLNRPSDILLNRRISLAFLGRHLPEILDAGVSGYVQTNESDAEVMELIHALAPKASFIDIEDFNKYAGVIDLDGNAWSERIGFLMMSVTPVIKQEHSHFISFLGHLLKDDENVFYFKEDMSDLVEILEYLVDEERFTPQDRESHVQRMEAFSREHLTHHGVIRAMAYSLIKLGHLSKWKVTMEEGYDLVSPADCCDFNPSLPVELIEKVRSKAQPQPDEVRVVKGSDGAS